MAGSTGRLLSCPPRFATLRSPDRPTLGHEIEVTMVMLRRRRAYPWQRLVADVAGEIHPSGIGFAHSVVVVVVPRRAGKTVLVLGTGLTHLRRADDVRAWYTAQRREDAAKQLRDEWAPMIEGSSLLQQAYRMRRSQGSEGVIARHGSSRLQIFPPTETALHGQNADTVFIDEGWAFDVVQGDALEAAARPAQLTRPWRQLWIVSAGGTETSTWLDKWMLIGQAGAPGVAYFEWSADPTGDSYDPGDPAVWASAHPSLGHGFAETDMQVLWDTKTSVEDFERQYLNVWPRPSQTGVAVIPELAWRTCADGESTADGRVEMAVAVTPERDRAAIAFAGLRRDGRRHVEVVDARPGVDWVVDRCAELDARMGPVRFTVDPAGPAGALLVELERCVALNVVSGRDYAAACGGMFDDVLAAMVAHRGQPVLDAAVATARRRFVGDAWVWARRAGADVSPLEAVTLARWALVTRPTTRPKVY